MPFKSEAQRKYLWANEPEIARDWTDTYGSRIQKAGGQLVQPGPGRPGYNGKDESGAYVSGGDWSAAETGGAESAAAVAAFGKEQAGDIRAATQAAARTTPKDERSWFQKNIYDRRPHDYTARSKHIQNLSKVDINKLIAAGLWQPGEEEDYFEGSWIGDSPLTSAESLRQLQDLTGYRGGFSNVNDPRHPDYNPGDGGQPYLPQGGIASIDDTTTASALGDLDFQVPLEYVVGQTRAAEGGRIGYQEGNMVGAEMEGAEMEGAMMQSQEVIKELYDALIAQGLSPQEAIEKIKEMIAASQAQESESPMMGEEFPGQEFRRGPRAPAAFGGIMDTYTGRRKYGLGSFLSKAKKKLKKLAGSKLGKIALMYIAGTYLGGTQAFGGTGQLTFAQRLQDPKLLANLINPTGGGIGEGTGWSMFSQPAPQLAGTGAYGGIERGAPLLKGATKQLTEAAVPWYKNPWITIPGASVAAGLYTAQEDEPEDISGKWDEDKAKWDKYYANLGSLEGGDYRVPKQYRAAQGGRIGYGLGSMVKRALGLGTIKGTAEADPGVVSTEDPDVMREKLLDYFKAKYSGWTEEAAQGGRIGYANGGMDDWYREYITRRNERGAKYNPSRSEYERHLSRPIPLGGTMPEGGLDEMRRQRREQGPAFFAIPTPTAQDGRIGAQEGGLMDLGGMEKDYRDDGGFVPLGGEEKADDVPARLSKNEFVFTADAVRNAGGGDIDRGAEVMENVMKNLEAGGQVSEESQGQGAQEMFEVSERLSEVV